VIIFLPTFISYNICQNAIKNNLQIFASYSLYKRLNIFAPEFNLTNNTCSMYHRYNKHFVLEEFQIPKNILGENVLLKVSRAGICRVDLQLSIGILKNINLLNYH
jgi:hypothetical protein